MTEQNFWIESPSRFMLTAFSLVIVFMICFTGYTLEGEIQKVQPQDIPSCQEDEYIQGSGDYSGGFWTSYVCEHDNS